MAPKSLYKRDGPFWAIADGSHFLSAPWWQVFLLATCVKSPRDKLKHSRSWFKLFLDNDASSNVMLAFAAVSQAICREGIGRSSSVYRRGHVHSSPLEAHFIVLRCAAGQLEVNFQNRTHAWQTACVCRARSEVGWSFGTESGTWVSSLWLPFASLLLQLSACACACVWVGGVVVVLTGGVSESKSSVCWRKGGGSTSIALPLLFWQPSMGLKDWSCGSMCLCLCEDSTPRLDDI